MLTAVIAPATPPPSSLEPLEPLVLNAWPEHADDHANDAPIKV